MAIFSFLSQTSNTFEGKKDYETVIVLLRRHWFVLAIQMVAFVLIALIPWAIAFLFGLAHIDTTAIGKYFALIVTIFYLFWWYGLFYSIAMYLLDIWIVTDHRIIDSEQHGFFQRTTAEISLAKIQDISVSITGVIPTFLDYGTLEVQSAGASEKFFFKEIPHPNAVRDMIMEAHNEFIKLHPNEVEVHER